MVTVRPDGVRIIPARAGFTKYWEVSCKGRRDHPRSRGVYSENFEVERRIVGSSPLARGLPAGGRPSGGRRGIIPARAGFT